MEATHVRFARDLEKRLSVSDRAAYYSGSVYPDSRYVTGIPRTDTHNGNSPMDAFEPGLTDFEKGWATHLMYDAMAALQKRTLLAFIPDAHRDDDWAFHTAVKLVEDLESVRVLGEEMTLIRDVGYHACPRNEDELVMRRYYRNLQEAYAGACKVEDYRDTSIKWNMPLARVERMIGLARAFSDDLATVGAILSIYPSVMRLIA